VSAPLISPAWRTRVMWVGAGALAVFAALSAWVAGGTSTSFDNWMFQKLYIHLGSGAASVLLNLSRPAVPIGICGLVALLAAVTRRWDVVALAALAPSLTVVLTKYVLKPLLGRKIIFGDYYYDGVFPSGHESAVAATAGVLVIVVFQLKVAGRVRWAMLTLVAAWTVFAAVGLVRNFWHYATDTVGSAFLAAAVVPAVALGIDRYGPVVWRRRRLTREVPATQSG
jgi:undecaprenyl-diphosphatase